MVDLNVMTWVDYIRGPMNVSKIGVPVDVDAHRVPGFWFVFTDANVPGVHNILDSLDITFSGWSTKELFKWTLL